MTQVAPQRRFIRRGVAKFFYIPTVADPDAGPTREEIETGFDFTSWIAAINGWATTPTTVPTPDMATRFDSTIPGNVTVADSSFDFYDDLDATEVEDTFPVGDTGYVYIMPKGDRPQAPASLFSVEVSNHTRNWTVDMTPANINVAFTISEEPRQDLTVPAAG